MEKEDLILQAITSLRNDMTKQFDEVHQELREIRQDLVEVHQELGELRQGLNEVRQDLIGVHQELGELRHGLNEVRQDLSDLTVQVKENTIFISALVQGQTKIEGTLLHSHHRDDALEARITINEGVTRQNSYEIMEIREQLHLKEAK